MQFIFGNDCDDGHGAKIATDAVEKIQLGNDLGNEADFDESDVLENSSPSVTTPAVSPLASRLQESMLVKMID